MKNLELSNLKERGERAGGKQRGFRARKAKITSAVRRGGVHPEPNARENQANHRKKPALVDGEEGG